MSEQSDNGLTLCLLPGSYFSQIAMLAFFEKRVKFNPHFILIPKMENLEPWFLKMNPKGQIPVAQDGDKYIPGSDKIFLYLDEKFCSENYPKLLPPKGSEEFQKVEKFDKLLRTFQNATTSFGIARFPELSSGLHIPEYEAKLRRDGGGGANEEKLAQILQDNPEALELITEKRKHFQMLMKIISDIDVVREAIASTATLLDEVEHELSLRIEGRQHWWLCSDQFTSADVILAVLLQRLDIVGLTFSLLDPTKRPCLVAYKSRVEQRQTYREYLAAVEELHQRFESLYVK